MRVFVFFVEILRFALESLRSNMLRTLLSSFGVIVGIFCIIGIFTFVDSLKIAFMQSLNSFISPRQVIVEKWPWRASGGRYAWWKFFKRPEVSYAEYQHLSEHLVYAKNIAITAGATNVLVKYEKGSVPGQLMGVSHSFYDTKHLNIVDGRYFSLLETEYAMDVAVIGHTNSRRARHFGSSRW